MPAPSPWHEGERALQNSVGVAARMEEVGRRVIRDHLIEQHREFYPLLPMVVLGGVDGEGSPWATVRTGPPGFLHAPDERQLRIDIARDEDDPAEPGFDDGADAALLGIDLSTRRRNRLNGKITRDAGGFRLAVRQSFGNCPKYIQLRELLGGNDVPTAPRLTPRVANGLTAEATALVGRADTFFVATYVDGEGGERSVDVSHRGGRPGFVGIEDDALVVPDYAGNLFFNTLGNILVNRRAGLAFLDFETGDLLQMTGRAEIPPPDNIHAPETGRFWRFHPEKVVWRAAALPLRWRLVELSPYLPPSDA